MQASPPISAGPFVEDIIESSYLSQIIDVFYIPISNLDVSGPQSPRTIGESTKVSDSRPSGVIPWRIPSSPKWAEMTFLPLMEEFLHQLRSVVYPTIYRVLCMPGGAGFVPSTVP